MIRLLVVDDSALMRKVFAQIFTREPDIALQFARNGVEALELLGPFAPDVVTLDIQMPLMDGLACLDRIMVERPSPVLMVASLDGGGTETVLEALKLGAVDFIAKPAGAISLRVDQFAPELVAKVRAAATARPRASLRLRERLRHLSGTAFEGVAPSRPARVETTPAPAGGEGIVLVGASTGGPPALEALLTSLPATFPWPIVVAQHMPAGFTGSLARRLDGLCGLTVTEVVQPTRLEPGHVYIGRGDGDIVVAHRAGGPVARPVARRPDYPWHPSTDRLVRSAMKHLPASQLIGVLLTGMGNDGADAMAAMRRAGGRTIAEAEETAVVWGMPGALVKAEAADWVLPLPRIADHLRGLTS